MGDVLPDQTATPALINVARCPEHGLHGLRTECFECGGPVEQVVYAEAGRTMAVAEERDRLRAENETLTERYAAVRHAYGVEAQERGRLGAENEALKAKNKALKIGARTILDALDAEKTPDYGVGHDRAVAAALKMLGRRGASPVEGDMVPLDQITAGASDEKEVSQ